jgi:hypothetical protein
VGVGGGGQSVGVGGIERLDGTAVVAGGESQARQFGADLRALHGRGILHRLVVEPRCRLDQVEVRETVGEPAGDGGGIGAVRHQLGMRVMQRHRLDRIQGVRCRAEHQTTEQCVGIRAHARYARFVGEALLSRADRIEGIVVALLLDEQCRQLFGCQLRLSPSPVVELFEGGGAASAVSAVCAGAIGPGGR